MIKRKFFSRSMLVGVFLGTAMMAISFVFAASSCGDGVCSVFEREAGDCQKDCSGFKGWCGNGKCELNENCRTCGLDCGFCGTATESEEQQEIPKVLCGDGVCSQEEGCGDCAEDCGACPGTWMGKMQYAFRRALRLARWYAAKGLLIGKQFTKVREALDFVDQQRDVLHGDALRRTEAAHELLLFFEEHDALRRNMSAVDADILDSVAGQGEQAGVLNFLPSLRIRAAARALVRQEEKDIQNALTELSKDGTLPATLPLPQRSLQELTEKLRRYQQSFPSVAAPQIGWFAGTAFAQNDGEKSISSTDAFLQSVQLLQEMRARAAGPGTVEPTIEENLAYLQNRSVLIAGILGQKEAELNNDLTVIHVAVQERDASSVLDAANVARFIRTSENFRATEDSYQKASRGMRSWFARFFFREEPHASAQEILSTTLTAEALQRFEAADFDAKREVLREIFQRKGEEKTSSLLAKLPEAEGIILQERFFSLQQALNDATSVSDLQEVLVNWRVLMEDLQRAVVRQESFLLRFFFPISSFFF